MPGGRPPRYKKREEIEGLIDKYFEECKGQPLIVDGVAVTDKNGSPVIIGAKPPTVTGLALALGFTSRQSLLNYQGKAEFVDSITRAKALIEEYVEGRLFDKDGVRGAIFSLANNFKGWKEKQDPSVDNGGVTIVDDIS